ncbi:MAG: hypothetical protein HFG39_15425 [Lachnospiraceae bacterium]|nr:hypothetical protein [Lachnospiraceae bacterium]
MAGYENIKEKGFDKRTTGELREIASKGGKASGESRKRKADFRRTLNQLLTLKIDSPEWTPLLESLGIDSTLESAINAAMIKEALSGNVKAYEVIARYSGQTEKTEIDQEEQKLHMEVVKAKMGVDSEEEAVDDGFLEALKGSASTDWNEMEDEETTNI